MILSAWPRSVGAFGAAIRLAAIGGLALALACGGPAAAQPANGQSVDRASNPPGVNGLRLYVFDCGWLIELSNPDRGAVNSANMSVSCYLVVHPRGTLLFDTGLSDDLVGQPFYEHQISVFGLLKTKSLKSQLAEIGVRPEQITYLALSHSHFDHSGNANDYTSATWLTPRAERDWMFRPEVRTTADFRRYADLERSKTVVYDGDHDVFGDGSVVLKASKGHTPGHQSLYVKLANTGGIVLSGDLYHRPEQRTPGLTSAPAGEGETGRSRAAIETFLQETKSQFWIGHDPAHFTKLTRAPGWYD